MTKPKMIPCEKYVVSLYIFLANLSSTLVNFELIKDHGLSYDVAALLLKGTDGYSALFYLILSDLCYDHLL